MVGSLPLSSALARLRKSIGTPPGRTRSYRHMSKGSLIICCAR